MGEYVWTQAVIGGELPANLVEEFEELAQFCNGDLDSGGVADAVKAGSRFTCNGECNYGNPEDLKAFCREHGLTYWIHYTAGSDWPEGGYVWKPGWDAERDFNAIAGDAAIDVCTLRQLHSNGVSLNAVIKALTELQADSVPLLTLRIVPHLNEHDQALSESIGA